VQNTTVEYYEDGSMLFLYWNETKQKCHVID